MTIDQIFHRSPTRGDRVFYLAGLVAIFVWYVALVFGREARLDETSLRTSGHVGAALLVAVASALKGLAWFPLLVVLPGCAGARAPRAGVVRGLVFVGVVAVGMFVLEPAGTAWLWSTEASLNEATATVASATEPAWTAATSQLPGLVLGALQGRPDASHQLLLHAGSVLLAAGGLCGCIGRRRLRFPWWLGAGLAYLAAQFAETVGRRVWIGGDGMREFAGNIVGMALACAGVAGVRALWGAPPSAADALVADAPRRQGALTFAASVLAGLLGGGVLLAHHAHGQPGGWAVLMPTQDPVGRPFPTLALDRIAGGSWSVSDERGHAVIVLLYSRWYRHREEALAQLVAQVDRHGSQNLALVLVATGDPRDSMSAREAATRPAATAVLASPGFLSALPHSGAPVTLFVDRTGVVRERIVGLARAGSCAQPMNGIEAPRGEP